MRGVVLAIRGVVGLAAVFVLGPMLTGCGGDVQSFSNEGTVCLSSTSDGTLEVAVMFPTCLSGCDSVLTRSCTVDVEGPLIVVESSGSYETPRRGFCDAACGFFIANCASEEPVPSGSYTVIHGEDEGEIRLPTSGAMIPEDESVFPSCDYITVGNAGS